MSKYKENPLYKAFISKDYDKIEALLDSENARDLVHNFGSEKSALHFAAQNGYSNLIKKIIDLDINLNIRDNSNCTPLYEAVFYQHTDTVRELINEGADVNTADSNGDTILHRAASKGSLAIFEMLLNKGANIDARNEEGDTLLIFAAFFGRIDIVRKLLCLGVDVNAKNLAGKTPLMVALEPDDGTDDHELIIRELLINGATIIDLGMNHNLLLASEFIDCIYKSSNTYKYQNMELNPLILPRLEFLIKKHGIPNHFLYPLNLEKSILPQITEMVNRLITTDQAIQEAIEPHLAIILNKIYPEQFPSPLPYSEVIKYQNQPADADICRCLLNSYKLMTHFKPREFLDYMLNPNNKNFMVKLFIECPTEIDLMFKEVDKLVLLSYQKANFTKLKILCDSPEITSQRFIYLYDIINNQQQVIQNLQAENHNLQDRLVDERMLSQQPRIDSFFIKKSATGIKRKAESSIDFNDFKHKTIKEKNPEREI